MAVDAHGNPVGITVTSATVADCKEFENVVERLSGAEAILADKAYDTDAIIDYVAGKNMKVVIPPKSNRKVQRDFDKYLYRHRHLVENAFLKLKRWRGVATRYAKNENSFLAIAQIACLMQWLKIL